VATSHDELRRYLGFGDADVERLARALPVVERSFARIVREFYDRILEHPEAAAAFRGPEQIERQEKALLGWLRRFFASPRDHAYFAETAKIGRVHVSVGLPQRYVLVSMNVIRTALHSAIRAAAMEDEAETLLSLHRGLDLELGVMIDSYFLAESVREQAAERREGAQRAQRLASIGILAAGLAHEIRNPLNGAQLHLTLARRHISQHLAADAELLEAMEVAGSQLKRLSNLVTEFLDLARPRSLELSNVDLCELAGHAASRVRADSDAMGIVVRLDLPATPLKALADRERITQALVNLLKNGLEAAAGASSAGEQHVTLRGRGTSEVQVLEVEDTGAGVSSGGASIFDAFFTTKAKGTGLGLSVAHRIVTDHEGTLTFASAPGRTVFTIKLPAHPKGRVNEKDSP